MRKLQLQKLVLFFTSIFATLYTYRPIFEGKLLGDPFDSRLQVVLHEHWWRWFNGLTEFRNTEFFFPYKTALGYSDVFFTQGIIYSLLRLFNFSLANSWTITTISLVVIGNLGWILIARKYIESFVFQVFFVITMCLSLSFVLYFTLNPNTVGYTFLSWIFIFYKNIEYEKKLLLKQIKINVFIIVLLIYSLSCWYGFFFFIFTLFFKYLLDIILQKNKLNFQMKIQKLKFSLLIVFLPIQIFLVWLFYYVYVSVSTQPYRPVEEMLRNSPRIELLANGANVNGAYLEGSFLKDFYIYLGLDKEYEYTFGIGIIAFILLFFAFFYYLINEKRNLKTYTLAYSIILVYSIFIVIGNFSLYKIFFELIPGFNSIRSPSRYVIFVGYFIIFLIFYTFDKVYKKYKDKKVVFFFISVFLILDQVRAPFNGWDESQFINTDLMSKKDEIIKNCDYFYYDKPGGWWYDQIEAMTFSIQVGVPTINGYSGAFPPDYPTEPFNSEKPPLKIFDWIAKVDKNLKGCFIAGSTPLKELNKDLMTVDLVGFTQVETDGRNTWQWAVSPNPYIFIINYSRDKLQLEFEINPARCNESQDFRITDDGKVDIFQGVLDSNNNRFNFTLDFTYSIVKRIELITKSKSCRFEGDPRDLFFEIKNLQVFN